MPQKPFEKAAGMLHQRPKMGEMTGTESEVEASRRRQAQIEKRIASAYRKGTSPEESADDLKREQEHRMTLHKRKKALPSYQEGGIVEDTGAALVHEGEMVVPAEKVSRAAAAMGGSKPLGLMAPEMPDVDEITIKKADNGWIVIPKIEGKNGRKHRGVLLTDPEQLHMHIDEVFGIEAAEPEETPEMEAAEMEAGAAGAEGAALEEPTMDEAAMMGAETDMDLGEDEMVDAELGAEEDLEEMI